MQKSRSCARNLDGDGTNNSQIMTLNTLYVDNIIKKTSSGITMQPDNAVDFNNKSLDNVLSLIFGSNNTATIVTAAQAGNRIFTIPNVVSGEFVMTQGNVQTLSNGIILGTSGSISLTASGSLITTRTANQMIFGTGNLVTISYTAPSASRLYTFADVGADCDVAMCAGAQTIAGAKTFTSRITSPVLIASIFRAAALGLTSGSTQTMPFDTLSYQSDSMWSAGTPTRITVPVAGKYQVNLSAVCNSGVNAGVMELTLTINGGNSIFSTFTFAANSQWTYSLSPILNLAANDFIQVTYFLTAASCTLSVNNGNRFSVNYLGS